MGEEEDEQKNVILDTLNAALEIGGWYGLYVCGANEEDYKAIADWAETNRKLFGFTVDCAVNGGIHNPVEKVYSYAFGMATKCLDKNENNRWTIEKFLERVKSAVNQYLA